MGGYKRQNKDRNVDTKEWLHIIPFYIFIDNTKLFNINHLTK